MATPAAGHGQGYVDVRLVLPAAQAVLPVCRDLDRAGSRALVWRRPGLRRPPWPAARPQRQPAGDRRVAVLVEAVPVVRPLLRRRGRAVRRLLADRRAASLVALVVRDRP